MAECIMFSVHRIDGEWQTRFYDVNGSELKEARYFATDQNDAVQTGQVQTGNLPDQPAYRPDRGPARLDLVGKAVVGANNGEPGYVLEAYDPAPGTQGAGTDCLVRWDAEELPLEWTDAGDLEWPDPVLPEGLIFEGVAYCGKEEA